MQRRQGGKSRCRLLRRRPDEIRNSSLGSAQSAENLEKLKTDRSGCWLKSPVYGIVYYGHFDHGKGTTGPQTEARKLVHGAG